MSTMKEKITHLMFVDDLKAFQKSEQKLAVVSNKIKSMMHDIGLELNLEKCASVHLKRTWQVSGLCKPSHRQR